MQLSVPAAIDVIIGRWFTRAIARNHKSPASSSFSLSGKTGGRGTRAVISLGRHSGKYAFNSANAKGRSLAVLGRSLFRKTTPFNERRGFSQKRGATLQERSLNEVGDSPGHERNDRDPYLVVQFHRNRWKNWFYGHQTIEAGEIRKPESSRVS
jgi:hypothetical protein